MGFLAAFEFWEIHQKECGASAVVWLQDDSGYFVCFSRGEYLDDIKNLLNLIEGDPLQNPFRK